VLINKTRDLWKIKTYVSFYLLYFLNEQLISYYSMGDV